MEKSANRVVIERLYDCFAAKDYDGFRALCSPDLEWIQNEGFPGGGHRHGAEEVIEKVFRAFGHDWEEWRFSIEDTLDAGDSIIVLGSYQGLHKETGRDFTAAAAHVYDLSNGKIQRFRQFTDTAMILSALPDSARS